MQVNASARLGRIYDGQPIGYTVLTQLRNELRPWTQDNVQSAGPGLFAVAGGVEMPDAGGFLAWGLEGQPAIAEDAIDPASNSTPMLMSQVNNALTMLLGNIRQLLPAPPPVIVETAHFDASIDQVRAEVAADRQRYLDQLSAVAESLSAIQEMTGTLSVLNDGANQVMALAEMQRRLSGILGEPTQGLRAVQEMSVSPLVTAIDALRGDMGQFVDKVNEGKRVEELKATMREKLDKLQNKLEGKP